MGKSSQGFVCGKLISLIRKLELFFCGYSPLRWIAPDVSDGGCGLSQDLTVSCKFEITINFEKTLTQDKDNNTLSYACRN